MTWTVTSEWRSYDFKETQETAGVKVPQMAVRDPVFHFTKRQWQVRGLPQRCDLTRSCAVSSIRRHQRLAGSLFRRRRHVLIRGVSSSRPGARVRLRIREAGFGAAK